MAQDDHIRARDARDRLIDFLGLGETYPLRDLEVRDERLVVPVDTPARIPIETSQREVRYQLRSHRDGSLIERSDGGRPVPVEADGTGETLLLLTPPIDEDVTYGILARKLEQAAVPDGGDPLEPREAYLHQTATVRVGLDTGLEARIRRQPPLDESLAAPADTDARLAPFGAEVEVEIDASQEGVMYALVDAADHSQELSQSDVRGDRHTITLTTKPVHEDLDIAIRASRSFDPADGRAAQTVFLDRVLPLRVRANPVVALEVTGNPIVEHGRGARLQLAGTQASARYRVYARPVQDREILYEQPAHPDELQVPVGRHQVRVPRPTRRLAWEDFEGFAPFGDEAPGSGGDLRLGVRDLTRDSVLLVRASKHHRKGLLTSDDPVAAETIESAVQLAQAALVLVRPNHEQPLRLRIGVEGDSTSGVLDVEDGQLGVFYTFRARTGAEPLGLPAYFHQPDEADDGLNEGIGQLRMDVDFVVARDGEPDAGRRPDPSLTPPPPPRLETPRLQLGTTLHVEAMRAHTRVTAELSRTAKLAATPVVRAEPAEVEPMGRADVIVVASQPGESYRLFVDGTPLGDARDGNGDDLAFPTLPLRRTTPFELVVTRPDPTELAVERVVSVVVAVRGTR